MRRTTDGGAEAENHARMLMVKCALALLGTPDDWRVLTAEPDRIGLIDT